MEWFKKNLPLVVSGLVAVALIGFAGYYLYGQIQKNARATANLAAEKQRYEGLARKTPGLGVGDTDNVKAAESQLMQLAAVESKLGRMYPPVKTIPADEKAFKLELAKVVSRVKHEGARAGMTVSNDFMLGFTAQANSFRFASNSLDTLVVQLADLTEIAEVILESGVISIEQVRRVKVSEDDSGASAVAEEYLPEDYLIMTNEVTGAVIHPYEVTVRTFSDGLGNLLKGFAETDYPVVVKTVEIEQTEPRSLDVPGLASAPSQAQSRYGAAQSRYGPVGGAAAGGTSRYADSRRTPAGGDRYGSGRDRSSRDSSRGGATTRQSAAPSQAEINRVLQARGIAPLTTQVRTEPVVAFSEAPLEVVLGLEVIHFPTPETTETASQ